VTILDGILAMEGEGPGKSGTPRELGIIAASNDAHALDITICRMLGIEPSRVLTVKAARSMGLIPEDIDVPGGIPAIAGFICPDIAPLVFGPQVLHGFMRRHLVQRPMPDVSSCRLCGECWKYCPAKAISRDGSRIRIDYEKCIRCYCCIEVCPHAALQTKEPLMGKVVRRLKRK
jgi:ferredoxin